MRVAVLGGGITGLTAAYRLAQSGASVTLFEASDRLGGLGTWFDYEGMQLDRFYHVMLDSDEHLLTLIDELGLTDRLRWSETKMGFFVRNRRYPFNTALDLLRFKALRFRDRIRTGLAALYITRLLRNGTRLDDELAHVWLRRLFGPRVYETIWEPLLIAKFGDLRDRVPAYWIWNTLTREKDGSQEVKGHIRGGYKLIADRLHQAINDLGGTVRLRSPVRGVETQNDGVRVWSEDGNHDFDTLLSTLPLPLLRRIAANGLAEQVPLPDLAYQGVVNVLLVYPEQLDEYYWTAVVDSGFPFQGIVEQTHVVDPEWIGGRRLIYLMNYCSSDSPAFKASDEKLKQAALDGLSRLYPTFDSSRVEAAFVFRAPHVEPVWTRGYLRQRPPCRMSGTPIYLATTAQAYPMVTSWNTSVKLAQDAVSEILRNSVDKTHSHAVTRITA